MSNIKITDFVIYREVVIKLCTVFGAWSKNNPNFMYRNLPYVPLIICLGIAVALYGFVQIHYTDILLLTRALSSLTGFILAILKMTCLIIHREKVFNLQKMLDIHFNNLLKHKHLTAVLLKNSKIYCFLVLSFIFFGFVSTAFQILIPLYMNLHGYYYHKQPFRNILIYPSSYPWTIPTSAPYFQLHFIFESMAAISLMWVTACFESLFSFYIFLMIGQLREMSYNITHIKNPNETEEVVKKCITQYSTLIQCCRDIRQIYGPIIIYIVAINSMILCFLMFQITQMKTISIFKIIIFFTYFSTKFLQTLIYSWCGTQLTLESEHYRNAIYEANWYENKNVMSNIIIMLEQKPLILSACGFTNVTIEIFLKVMNRTVSFYLMLKTLDAS